MNARQILTVSVSTMAFAYSLQTQTELLASPKLMKVEDLRTFCGKQLTQCHHGPNSELHFRLVILAWTVAEHLLHRLR